MQSFTLVNKVMGWYFDNKLDITFVPVAWTGEVKCFIGNAEADTQCSALSELWYEAFYLACMKANKELV